MPILQEKAGEESSSDNNSANSGVGESKREASSDESTPTFATVVLGTPTSVSNPPNYDKIIANKYDPLKEDSDSETATHIDDSHKNPFTLDSDPEPDTTGVSLFGVGGIRNEDKQKDITNIITTRPATATHGDDSTVDTANTISFSSPSIHVCTNVSSKSAPVPVDGYIYTQLS